MNKRDEEIRQQVHEAVDGGLPHMQMTAALRRGILEGTTKAGKPHRRLSLSLALALALLLAMAAIGIAATRFGILDANRQMKDNEAFVEHILAVDETYENEYMTLTVNDAVFDGVTLMLTMDVQPKDGCGDGVYVYPQMSATVNGESLDVEIEAYRGDLMSGFWVPERDGSMLWLEGTYGADYVLTKETKDGRIVYNPQTEGVTWTLTLDILRPVYAVRQNAESLTEDMEYGSYMQQFTEAYAKREILLDAYGSPVEYVYAIPRPEGTERLAWQRTKLSEKLEASGAFERMDTAKIVFTTEGTQVAKLEGEQVYDLDEYEAVLKSLSVTFGRLDYEIHVSKTSGGKTAGEEYAARELDLEFAVLIDGCEAKLSYESSHPLNDNSADPDPVVYYRGGFTLLGEAKGVTFIPCRNMEERDAVYEARRALTPEQEAASFTIELE